MDPVQSSDVSGNPSPGPGAPDALDPSAFRRLAELSPDARLQSEVRFRAFFEAATEAMGVSLRGLHLLANPAYARLFGFERPEELIGSPILDLIAPSDRERVAEAVRRRSAGAGAPDRYDVRARRRDGSEFLMEVRASTYLSESEVHTVVVLRDVTEARAYATRLEERERHFRELFDQVPVGVWVEDLSGAKAIIDALRARGVADLGAHFLEHPEDVAACAQAVKILEVNATACQTVGARDQAELLANLHRVFLPETLGDFAKELLQLAEGRTETLAEGWNGTLQGGRRWVVARGVLAAGHEADWSRVVLTIVDVTERRRAREERARLEERLRHAEKLEALGRLAGGVAHDFNNILVPILGFAELALEESQAGSPLHESQLQIREAAQRARDLVSQILAFSRRDQPEPRPIDAAGVVTKALALARKGIPAPIEFVTRVEAGTGSVLSDATQLHQIVLNLCSNARDAVGSMGRVEVTLAPVEVDDGLPGVPAGRYVLLRVSDDGVGMDEATQARLFEPYMTTKGGTGGHGLGLAVVHGIVTSAGGAIRVESAPRRGSTFEVYLPRLQTQGAAAVAAAASGSSVKRGTERILIVDDEPLVRSTHRRVLQSLGYTVTEAPDALSALELLRREPGGFDLVLTDQSMPILSGADFARQLLAEQPGARVILCSGYSDAIDEPRALALGIRALLVKPVDRIGLAAALRRAFAEPDQPPPGAEARAGAPS